MRKEYIIPAVALGGGAVGLGLRLWELGSAFEADTGLAIPGAPASVALIALSVLAAAALLTLCQGKHGVFPGGYDQAFRAEGSMAYIIAKVLSAFLLLGAGGLIALDLPAAYVAEVARLASMHLGGSPVLAVLPTALLAVLCLLSCPCVLMTGKNNYRAEGRGKNALALLVPAFAGCAWLITAYQKRAADPVQLDYAYELFAIVAAVLALYYAAGFSFERAKVARAVWTSAMGVYFCLVTLADGHGPAQTLLYLAFALSLGADLAALLVNDRACLEARPEIGGPETGEPEGPRMSEDQEPLPTQTEIELEFSVDAEETESEDTTHE